MTSVSSGFLILLFGCAPTHLSLQYSPAQAIDRATGRLTENGVSLDETSRTPTRIRSPILCYVPHDHHGLGWNRSLSRIGPGLRTIDVVGAHEVQEEAGRTCPHQFRYTVSTEKTSSGSQLTVMSEWWALKPMACQPHGDPAMAQMKCTYRYQGSPAQADINHHIYRLLAGL